MATKRKSSKNEKGVLEKDETINMREKYIASSCKLFFKANPIKIVSAKGQYMYDEEGKKYLDCINNVAHVGHCHPDVVKAGIDQMTLLNTNSRFLHDNIVLLGKNLASIMPGNLSVCFFVNSGSEANDLALRLAKTHTGGSDVVVLDHAYHGHTTAVMELSPYKFSATGGSGKPDTTHVVPCCDTYRGLYTEEKNPGEDLGLLYANEVKAATDKITKNGRSVSAFFAESLQSCGGQIVLPKGFLKKSYKYVRDAGGVCIADEVQVGFGRVGTHWWAFDMHDDGTVPDIVTLGKPMGNGHPISAVVTTPEIARNFSKNGMEYFNTFGGNPVSCAIALSVLETIKKEKLRENASTVGQFMLDKLEEMKETHRFIGDVRGIGFFIGIELVRDKKTKEPATAEAQQVIYRLKEKMVLLSADGPDRNVLKFKPPMVFSMSNAEDLLAMLDEILSEIEEDNPDLSSEKLAERMHGSANGQSRSATGQATVKKLRAH